MKSVLTNHCKYSSHELMLDKLLMSSDSKACADGIYLRKQVRALSPVFHTHSNTNRFILLYCSNGIGLIMQSIVPTNPNSWRQSLSKGT